MRGETAVRSTMIGLARRQRRNNVTAEAIVWRALRDRRSDGFKFRRQVPIGAYIADFICFEKRLIVEIDGPSHETAAQRRRDAGRDDWFRHEGFTILRLPNDFVIGAPDLAIGQILEALK
jgi:very-short-patch-repair endonuclease